MKNSFLWGFDGLFLGLAGFHFLIFCRRIAVVKSEIALDFSEKIRA